MRGWRGAELILWVQRMGLNAGAVLFHEVWSGGGDLAVDGVG